VLAGRRRRRILTSRSRRRVADPGVGLGLSRRAPVPASVPVCTVRRRAGRFGGTGTERIAAPL